MTEEERLKKKDFDIKKQKLDEEKEKIKKNLENELKKTRNDVTELCQRIDDQIFLLFRKKLEYDYRIYEQELNIV